MINAILIRETGGADVLKYEQVELGQPKAGEARIRHEAVGLNFIDVYFRTGLYKAPQLPFIPGQEGAGTVVAVGEGVTNVKVGDRVAYTGAMGSYADERLIAADRLVKVPENMDLRLAASMMLKGMTAYYLINLTYKVQKGDTILIHAAAGGVGQIAGQWAKHLGATVIGTAGSQEKIDLALSLGYDHVINYREDNFVEKVKEITGGKGLPVVYDSVGKDTFPASLQVLQPRGLFVSYGNASGPVPPFELALLNQYGSLYATRPTLGSYIATREELERAAQALFDVVASGAVKINVNQTYALRDAAQAQRDLEARKTTGTTILIP
ncbi:quinone oxidoreductase [Pseudochrobactrum algeriensis]|uniref:quinone oxidoreductase family protein n=1 Tax=Pseudochrobactrum algeriensis TaxID=2834768 RepID=UPI001BCCF432|nr:quinone oxidoreductase [Pseudochrobactrum algeriensis]MBX8783017.1 quinone oxidoreductase [Ochrobactrum sp. GRS2]MBX8811328.1 quinone oxidoreductase [Ochrobactrum sp. MR34]QVQ38065.1 quinone oxidoreductase [Pseudochrobactrum algeriensis]QVQ41289.1 quinone oxidoreductase [Pseudochrobactrum algeriensis]QVQ45212.1 quinone oxidoreductase [Pseudochrobactrum algeriensis]